MPIDSVGYEENSLEYQLKKAFIGSIKKDVSLISKYGKKNFNHELLRKIIQTFCCNLVLYNTLKNFLYFE